jgi:hypothetical protein
MLAETEEIFRYLQSLERGANPHETLSLPAAYRLVRLQLELFCNPALRFHNGRSHRPAPPKALQKDVL